MDLHGGTTRNSNSDQNSDSNANSNISSNSDTNSSLLNANPMLGPKQELFELQFFSPEDPFLCSLSSLFQGVSYRCKVIFGIYMVLAAVALILPGYYGYRYDGNFWKAMFGKDDATTCLSIDLVIVLLVFLTFLWTDMKQLSFCIVTFAVLVCCCAVALSFPFPVYLGFRAIRVDRLSTSRVDDVGQRASVACSLAVLVVLAITSQVVFNSVEIK